MTEVATPEHVSAEKAVEETTSGSWQHKDRQLWWSFLASNDSGKMTEPSCLNLEPEKEQVIMDEQRKQELIESAKKLTLEGIPCVIGGWQHDYVTLVPDFGGIWQTSWETLERAIQGDGTLTATDVELFSWIWKGKGQPIPDPIRGRFPLPHVEHLSQ